MERPSDDEVERCASQLEDQGRNNGADVVRRLLAHTKAADEAHQSYVALAVLEKKELRERAEAAEKRVADVMAERETTVAELRKRVAELEKTLKYAKAYSAPVEAASRIAELESQQANNYWRNQAMDIATDRENIAHERDQLRPDIKDGEGK